MATKGTKTQKEQNTESLQGVDSRTSLLFILSILCIDVLLIFLLDSWFVFMSDQQSNLAAGI